MIDKRLRIPGFILFLLMLLCLICCNASCDESFQIRRIGNIHPYEKNSFEVVTDEEGLLTITIHDNESF